MRKLLMIALLGWTATAGAQNLLIGAGQLEGFHAGISYPLSSRFQGITSLGAGIPVRQETFTLTQKFVLTSLTAKRDAQRVRFGSGLNITTWYFNNQWNTFQNISFGPEIQTSCRFRGGSLTACAGWLWNSVIYYRRKTDEQVGWSRNWQPSFGIRWEFNKAG